MDILSNATVLIGDIQKPFTINCNSTSSTNQQITWIQTLNKTNIYLVQNDSRISFGLNGQQLNFANLLISDDEYYSCGYLTTNNRFQILSNFYLFIRGIFHNLLK